ncbi:MAG: hydrogenase maturation nickel metallochaperone HypA [Dehalococcoidales bacterium]|nr:hydrogenase maturation nickel metallochaperone HypA [Dehalococcoidales bacterium]
MHEFTITQSILSIALEKAGEVKASRISGISITLGELSGIVDESVQFYFEFLSKETIAAGATLNFVKPRVQLRCRKCATVFSPNDSNWVCPGCREQGIEVVSGRECYVESIEVE